MTSDISGVESVISGTLHQHSVQLHHAGGAVVAMFQKNAILAADRSGRVPLFTLPTTDGGKTR